MYRLHISNEPNVIGAKDGFSLVISEDPSLDVYENIPEFTAYIQTHTLNCFRLVEKAKIIDAMECANNFNTTGIVVSEKVKNIMQKFNLYSTQFIPCKIKSKNIELEGFYLLHCYSYLLDKIDYSRTSFSRIWPFPRKVEESYGFITEKVLINESRKIAGSVKYIESDKCLIFDKFDVSTSDLFKIGWFDEHIYISNKLKSALEEFDLIGFEFSDASDLF